MSSFKYGLDPSSKKHQCPQCKQRSFVVYLDLETKQPVDQYQFGRCDRENNCGYHLHPSADPELAAKARPENFTPTPAAVIEQIFPEDSIWRPLVERTKTCISPLHLFCNKKLLIPFDHMLKWGVVSDTDKAGNDLTAYIFRNTAGQVCNIKWFKYKPDGHRDKNFDSYSLKQPKTPPHPPKNKDSEKSGGEKEARVERKYQMCLFGEHLLSPIGGPGGTKIVCVVESEKTAFIAAFFYPQYDWVSCASNNGLTVAKLQVLKGREVWWLCDADKAGRMTVDEGIVKPSSVRHLLEHIEKCSVVDLFPDRHDGYDIGDAIVDGVRPDIIPTWTKGVDTIAQAPEKFKDNDFYDYDLPKGVDFDNVKWDLRKYMHFEHEGLIFIARKKKDKDDNSAGFYCIDITNFTIKSLGLIASKQDPRRLVEIKNKHGLTKVLQLPTTSFASQTEFTALIESEGNFQWDGVGTDLKKVRSRLYDTMESYEEVDSLGWHRDGYFLFANGAYNGKFSPTDKYGFVKLNDKRFYIEALSALSREDEEEWEDEKKFVFKMRDIKLKEWADLFCKVHKDNGKITLAWFITSLFRDFIYQRFKFFPHLFLFGPPGTGKSQQCWSIRAMGFNGLVKPFNLNTGTAVAFHRELSFFKNFPAWFDEYDNSIAYERIQSLKAAYDGVGHKKSVKDSDKRTKASQVNRGLMISGQQLPIADNALFKRVILLQFNQTEFSDDEKKIYADLQTMEDGGLTHITAGFMHFRKLMEDTYMNEFDLVIKDITTKATELEFEPEDRIARNSAITLTTIKVLETKIGDMMPYKYADLLKVMMANMKSQMSLISNTNETNSFWDMVMYLARERRGVDNGRTIYAINEGEDFCFESKKIIKVCVDRKDVERELTETTELIFIRFQKIFPLYREAFKKQNSTTASPMDKSSLMHYLTHSKPFLGMVTNYQFRDSRTSCYVFSYAMLKAMGIYLGGSESGGTVIQPTQNPGPKGPNQGSIDFKPETNSFNSSDDLPF